MRLSAAIRTRSDGEWHGGSIHYGKLEIGREVMNSLTRVAKDTLVMEIYDMKSNRQKTMEWVFNKSSGVCAYYHSGKRNSVAELRLHAPTELITSLTIAHIPKIIKIYEIKKR